MTIKQAVILQPFGIGDSIFCQTIARKFIDAGYDIIWPVLPQFLEGLQYAYPEIGWRNSEDCNHVDFDCKIQKVKNGLLHIPLRWSMEITGCQYKDVMGAKYGMYGYDYQDWKKYAPYNRNLSKEAELMVLYGIVPGEQYNLINNNFQSDFGGVRTIKTNNGLQDVMMENVPGYSLFDYSSMIEQAAEVHVISSSIFYLLELLNLKQPLHLYSRDNGASFSHIDYLFTKPYILHP